MSPETECVQCDCDVVIIGAGPAGLSTAVYAGAEECAVRLLDAGDRPGGQAGQSTQIRNFFGFPDGVSGPELAALGVDGALSFGVDLRAPVLVHDIERVGERFVITAVDDVFSAKSVVIATGATPRRHKAKGVAAYYGRGVSYRGPDSENGHSGHYSGVVYIVGGGNSAGQAATFLAREGCEVHILVRGAGLAASMSRYLIREIDESDNITLHTNTELIEVLGERPHRRVTNVVIREGGHPNTRLDAQNVSVRACDYLYLMLGSDPNTAWLRGKVALDRQGHVLTGTAVELAVFEDRYGRLPMPHESSIAGIFAAGDVRAGALKRVAAAVGEGAGAYFDVHRYINA